MKDKSYANGNGETFSVMYTPLWLRRNTEYAEWCATQMHWAILV